MTAKTRRGPSHRNLEIYRAVAFLARPQEQVAAEHKISRQRVGQICLAVEQYAAQFPDEKLPFLTNPQRAIYLRDTLRERLEHKWQQLMREWSRSLEIVETLRVSTEETLDGTGNPIPIRKKRRIESTRKAKAANVRAMEAAIRLSERIFKLSGGSDPKPFLEYCDEFQTLSYEEKVRRVTERARAFLQTTGVARIELDAGPAAVCAPEGNAVPLLPAPTVVEAAVVPQPELP